MTDESPRRPMPSDGRLWTDPREGDERQQWLRPPEHIHPVPPLGEPEPAEDDGGAGDRRRRRRRAALAVLACVLLLGTGAVLGGALGGDDALTTPAALRAVPGAAPADARSRTIRAVYAAASPSVVSVRVRDGAGAASGTGFLVAPGTIVTNAHVVDGADTAQVRLDDRGRVIDADIVGSDPSSDLAVLRVDRGDTSGLRPLALADSDSVQVGDLAIAIGYPLGLDRTATAGIVSGLGRSIEAPNGFSIDEVIQTDAPINPGNSGGPLLDAAGRVIGVNSQIATTGGGGGSVGIGFAVPSETVSRVVPRLQRGQAIRRAYLGVSTGEAPTGTGAVVGGVVPSGPADAAGLRLGDVIRRIGDRRVQGPDDVTGAVGESAPGDRVEIEVDRGGTRATVSVTLGTRPARTP
jgi:putative serine protease PepD